MAVHGRAIRIEYAEDGVNYVNIAGARTDSLSFQNEAIDITGKNDTGIPTVLNDSASTAMTLSCTGVASEVKFAQLARAAGLNSSLHAFRISFGDLITYTGNFFITAFELTGEMADISTFTLSLQSSGTVSADLGAGEEVGPIIVGLGSVDKETFFSGAETTLTGGIADPRGGGVVTYELRFVVDGLTVATLSTSTALATLAYTYLADQEGDVVSIEWRAIETSGTTDGATDWQIVSSGIVTVAEFSEVVQPVDERMYDTQVLSTITNFSTYTDTANYSSTGGAIDTAVIQTQDGGAGVFTTRSGSYQLEEGQRVRVRVEDVNGNVATYTIEVEVEPEDTTALVVDVLETTINSIVPDSEDVAIDVSHDGAYFDGTYTFSQDDLDAGPVLLADVVLVDDGTPAVGETLDIIPALFAYDDDNGSCSVSYTTTGTNTVDVTDPDAPTLLIDAADAGSTITVTATATQGMDTTDSVSNGVTVPAVLSYEIIATETDASSTTTPSFTVTLPAGAASGDKLLLVYGPGSTVTSLSVDGDAQSSIQTSGGSFFGENLEAFEYTLDGMEGGSVSVTMVTSSSNNHVLKCVLVKNGSRDDTAGDAMGGAPTPISGEVTCSGTDNLVVAVAMGRASIFDDHIWTNATEQDIDDPTAISATSVAVAVAEDVGTSAYTVTFTDATTSGGSDEAGLIVVAYSKV